MSEKILFEIMIAVRLIIVTTLRMMVLVSFFTKNLIVYRWITVRSWGKTVSCFSRTMCSVLFMKLSEDVRRFRRRLRTMYMCSWRKIRFSSWTMCLCRSDKVWWISRFMSWWWRRNGITVQRDWMDFLFYRWTWLMISNVRTMIDRCFLNVLRSSSRD